MRKRIVRLSVLLCLLPSAGVACGPGDMYSFAAVSGIALVDGGPNCPRLTVGADVIYDNCFDKPWAPQFVFDDPRHDLLLITTSPEYTETLVDPGFRIVASSDHYVVVQKSAEVAHAEVRFTLLSAEEVDWCHITEQHVIRCHRLVFNA